MYEIDDLRTIIGLVKSLFENFQSKKSAPRVAYLVFAN